MINKFIKFLFRPTLNAVDVAICVMLLVMSAQIGLWVIIPAVALAFLSSLEEKKMGWEVFNNSRD